MASVQELAKEAYIDLLTKHCRPVTLKEALEACAARKVPTIIARPQKAQTNT